MTYISYPITSDPTDILLAAYNFIQSKVPAWQPNDGNLDVWILEALASEASDLRELATDVPDTIFRYFGSTILGIAPIDDVAATADSTWTLTDSLGHTIPAGTFVSIVDDNGIEYAFMTETEVAVPVGQNVTGTGGVPLVAVIPGSASSGLGGVGSSVTLIDTLEWVSSIVLTAATSGGVDAESPDEYNDRLSRRLLRLSLRPILPADFANAALDVAGVYRAVAIDGYDPGPPATEDNDRTITVAAVDVNGTQVSGAIKTALDAYLQANREVNFVVHVIDPNYTDIDVTFTIEVLPNFNVTDTVDNAEAAVVAMLDPAIWGRDPSYTDASSAQTWVESTTLYYNNVITTIGGVEGVSRVASCTIGISGGTMGTTDVTLTAPASLTGAGTIAGSSV